MHQNHFQAASTSKIARFIWLPNIIAKQITNGDLNFARLIFKAA